MTQIMNFKRMEVTGATKDEALAKAPFDIMGDATQAYKIWKKKQGACRGSSEDDVAGFQGHVLGEVSDELGEGENHVRRFGDVFLH